MKLQIMQCLLGLKLAHGRALRWDTKKKTEKKTCQIWEDGVWKMQWLMTSWVWEMLFVQEKGCVVCEIDVTQTVAFICIVSYILQVWLNMTWLNDITSSPESHDLAVSTENPWVGLSLKWHYTTPSRRSCWKILQLAKTRSRSIWVSQFQMWVFPKIVVHQNGWWK